MSKEKANTKPKPKLMQAKLANKYYLGALDHSMIAGSGLALQDFAVGNACLRLQKGERRLTCDMSDMP